VAVNGSLYFVYYLPRMTPLIEQIHSIAQAPTTTNFNAPRNWSPAAGTVHVHPIMNCSTATAPGASNGTGANLTNNNVELINPEARGCSYAIINRAAGTKITFDPNQPGYGSASAPNLRNNRYGILIEAGSRDVQIQGVNGGRGFIRDTFRPIIVRSLQGGVINDNTISHVESGLNWQAAGDRSVVGIKFLCDYRSLPSNDRSCRDVVVSNNNISGVDEEGMSLDANMNDTTSPAEQMVQNTSRVNSVNAANDTVTLAEGTSGLQPLVGAYMSVVKGPASIEGRYLHIRAVSGSTITVNDPNNYLASLRGGDEVSLGARYYNIDFVNNTINANGSFVGVDFYGPVNHSTFRNNSIPGDPVKRYAAFDHLRDCNPGSGYLACVQSFRNTTLVTPTGPGSGDEVGIASFNSVTGNEAKHDISFNVRRRTDLSNIPAYQANNTFTGPGQIWNDGSYLFLGADPN
jgi:hypothetical protein